MSKNYVPTVEDIQQFGNINMALFGMDGEYGKYILAVKEKVIEAGCPYETQALNAFVYGLIVGMSINKQ